MDGLATREAGAASNDREMIEARFKLTYPGFALDADLTLPGQGITALFGRSGSGKTTLLRAIAGLERVPDGRLVIAGEVWQDDKTFLPTHDTQWHLARGDFPGGGLWVRDQGHPLGRHVRIRILARDVSIAPERITGTSIQNTLPATVAVLAEDAHPALRLVQLSARRMRRVTNRIGRFIPRHRASPRDCPPSPADRSCAAHRH
jgi:ABC-type molybdate transport system ATPase subunit